MLISLFFSLSCRSFNGGGARQEDVGICITLVHAGILITPSSSPWLFVYKSVFFKKIYKNRQFFYIEDGRFLQMLPLCSREIRKNFLVFYKVLKLSHFKNLFKIYLRNNNWTKKIIFFHGREWIPIGFNFLKKNKKKTERIFFLGKVGIPKCCQSRSCGFSRANFHINFSASFLTHTHTRPM